MNRRMEVASRSEPATYAELRRLGFAVQIYGQAMLPDAAREMLRGVPTPERWIADFLVTRPPVTGLRVPAAMGTKKVLLVDAKYSWGDTENHSIEMRSLLAASVAGLPTYFVCSQLGTDENFSDFGVIFHRQVLRGRHRPCCSSCDGILKSDPDPMRALPEYCPNQPRNRRSSGTPYVVFSKAELHPLTDFVFDLGLDGDLTDHSGAA